MACRRKEAKIEEVGKNFTQREESESMHQGRANNDTRTTTKTSLLLQNSYEGACDVFFIFGA